MARTELRNHPKFKRLVRRLRLPVPYVVGLLECIWHVGYETGDSLIGDPEDVELAAEWPGKPGVLFDALKNDWLDERGGKFHIHDLGDHAPVYVKRKLHRRNIKHLGGKTGTNGVSMDTCNSNRQVTDTDTVTDTLPTGSTAGAVIDNSPKPRKEPTGTHHAIVAHFCECWKRRYGCDYPFLGGKDGKHAKTLRKRVNEDLQAAKLLIDRYFESEDRFIVNDRHSFGMLISQIRKFLVTSEDAASGAVQVYPSAAQAESWVKP